MEDENPLRVRVNRTIIWLGLACLSIGFTLVLEVPRFPAALLLGPMAAAVCIALLGSRIDVYPSFVVAAQGIVGLMIGAGLPSGFESELIVHWPAIVGGTITTIAISTGLGLALSRSKHLPGSTALWGFSAGAAAVMTFMSREHGADFRLVAFMQYLRVACVALSAGVVVRFSAVTPFGSNFDDLQSQLNISSHALIFVVALGFARVGKRINFPGSSFLLPLAAGVILSRALGWEMMPPLWMKIFAFFVIGWVIGLRFSPDLIRYAARALPVVTVATFVMILSNGLVAVVLSKITGLDLLTVYLATSPGGADSVAIIAASLPVDTGFVTTMQTTRLLAVLAAAPVLARKLSSRISQ